MSDVPSWLDYEHYELLSPTPASFPRGPSGTGLLPVAGHVEQGTALCFVGLLLLLLLFLIVRCIRILLDPYNSMTATSWTNDPRDPLERGHFDYALV
ncbi:cortexin-1-like [Oncorhynchus clarkii lewisi]|uniref:cortexin-1-like n=1 Tax=Oncorhynchus clarkii lewisi TaxID=490388 RepID=UPI0039B98F31